MSNWEYAAIVKLQEQGKKIDPRHPEIPGRWRLVGPGNGNHAPRIYFHYNRELEGLSKKELRAMPEDEQWISPVGKNYWEFNDHDEASFDKALKSYEKIPQFTKLRTEARSRKIHFEAQDILTLINIAGKEGWEITGGIGKADGSHGGPHETRYRAMRREI